jgi:hypothetical protein
MVLIAYRGAGLRATEVGHLKCFLRFGSLNSIETLAFFFHINANGNTALALSERQNRSSLLEFSSGQKKADLPGEDRSASSWGDCMTWRVPMHLYVSPKWSTSDSNPCGHRMKVEFSPSARLNGR